MVTVLNEMQVFCFFLKTVVVHVFIKIVHIVHIHVLIDLKQIIVLGCFLFLELFFFQFKN